MLVLMLQDGEGDSLLFCYSVTVTHFFYTYKSCSELKRASESFSSIWPDCTAAGRIWTRQEKHTGFIFACVCVSRLPRSHYWLQSLLLPPDFHSLASSDCRASKHVGEVLLSLDGIRVCLCLCMSFSTIPWEPWRWKPATFQRGPNKEALLYRENT